MNNSSTNNILLGVIAVVLLGIGGLVFWMVMQEPAATPAPTNTAPVIVTPPPTTTNVDTSVDVVPSDTDNSGGAAGIQPAGPPQATGEPSYTNTSEDEIRVSSPVVGQVITSPFTVTGEARGSWFFEATAPMVVVDWDGRIIGEGYVTAVGDWMTDEFVPFEGEVTFTPDISVSSAGALILQKSNASDLPENDAAVEIAISFQ